MTAVVLSPDAFLNLYVDSKPFSLICSGGGNIRGMFYFFECSTAKGSEGNPPNTSVVGSTLQNMLTCPYSASARMLCAKQQRGHGLHSPRVGGEMLKRVFHSGRRKGRLARAHLCVGAAPHRALTPLTLCTPVPLFPCWTQARRAEEDFLSFCFTSFLIEVSLSLPRSKTTSLAGPGE